MMFCAFIPGHSGHVMVCVVNVVHLVQSEIQRQEETIDIAQYQSQLLGTFPAARSVFRALPKGPRKFNLIEHSIFRLV